MNQIIAAILEWIKGFFLAHEDEIKDFLWKMLLEIVADAYRRYNSHASEQKEASPAAETPNA